MLPQLCVSVKKRIVLFMNVITLYRKLPYFWEFITILWGTYNVYAITQDLKSAKKLKINNYPTEKSNSIIGLLVWCIKLNIVWCGCTRDKVSFLERVLKVF